MSAPARLSGLGLAVTLPKPWEGRIYQRPLPVSSFASPVSRASAGGDLGWAGEVTRPILHLGNFPLPAGRGDYGTGAVERMGSSDIFVSLLQFGPDELGTALYAAPGLPRPTPADFDPAALQRRVAGQAGYQRFFTHRGHPMCLFIVLGDRGRVGPLCREVNTILAGVEVAAR
ncbi:hypothetical protein SAMN05892883_0633 [Jatrophihabitans sp. GAS493]|uniref:hypothetical protein n=1 Tax=Jatrophihabitans sp. GAS493 TaxID=1907575 RepID=UPI000BB780A4|nr:hypothetical protein [Jatrophihabitans sp. GAS493]SOD71031.1 hypothetical protein SAMN05892883_0633 [Jatrophihabitans sp. GAS493]